MNEKIIKTKDIYCPYCNETHMHIEKPDGMMCLACRRIHDGVSFRSQPDEAPTERKALG